jgi:hypothetical protein
MFLSRYVILVVTILITLSALPALGADLKIRFDKEKKTATVTNMLPTKVVLLSLLGKDHMALPLYARLEKGATVVVPLRFIIPQEVDSAICELDEALKGYEREDDRHYHLSVELH